MSFSIVTSFVFHLWDPLLEIMGNFCVFNLLREKDQSWKTACGLAGRLSDKAVPQEPDNAHLFLLLGLTISCCWLMLPPAAAPPSPCLRFLSCGMSGSQIAVSSTLALALPSAQWFIWGEWKARLGPWLYQQSQPWAPLSCSGIPQLLALTGS